MIIQGSKNFSSNVLHVYLLKSTYIKYQCPTEQLKFRYNDIRGDEDCIFTAVDWVNVLLKMNVADADGSILFLFL